MSADMNKDRGLETISRFTFGTLCLFRIKDTMLFKEIEAEDALLVGFTDWTWNLQQIVEFCEVVKADLEAGVHDSIDVVHAL